MTLPILILNGRPAAGKSELINYLHHLPDSVRRKRYHIGPLIELDDFPMLWTWFEEDALLEKKFNRPRLHTTPEGNFIHHDLWNLLIERLNLEYDKFVRDRPEALQTRTALIEFSRGTEHGGYRAAYPHLSDMILKQAAIFYIDVSYSESLRKNRKRFNPDKPDSILEHGLTDERLELLYKEIDWHDVAAPDPETINIRGFSVPYVVFSNEDDLTTQLGSAFEARLEEQMGILWSRWKKLHP